MSKWPLLNRARNHGVYGAVDCSDLFRISPINDGVVPLNIDYAEATRPKRGDSDAHWDKRVFQNTKIRPPFQLTWFEWHSTSIDAQFAVLVMVDDEWTWFKSLGFFEKTRNIKKTRKTALPCHYSAELPFRLYDDSELYSVENFPGYPISLTPFGDHVAKISGLSGLEHAGNFVWQLNTTIWSWLLLSCKNVETVEIHPSTRREDGKKDPSRVVYRELHVSLAPGQQAQHVNESDDHGAGVAFHVRRGHFADYTKGNGLFGKYKGRYWIGPTTVGDPQYGTVLKSYSIVN